MVQCQHLKINNKPCTRDVSNKPGTNPLYCWQHQAQSMSLFAVNHVQLITEKPFAQVKIAFEQQLGKSTLDAFDSLMGYNIDEQKTMLEARAGTSGFMLFGTVDHSRGLKLVGQNHKAIQYIIGNPLFATEMTQYDIRAALYAPLRVLLYENKCNQTCFEYDKSVSLFGQFGDERITHTAIMLDQKLEALTKSSML
jgi:uncharacterized protein (DUF302 family)